MPIIPSGISRLSQLIIDAAKNWAGFKIENLGAPDSGDDAKRHDSVPAAHTLGSHSTKAHAELTGVGASDHHVKTTSFADITDRAGASKLNWTLNKLLKGAGAGADPTEIDVPVAVNFTELLGAESYAHPQASIWRDWDLSAIIPAGAKAVLIIGHNIHAANSYGMGARKNGSALLRSFTTQSIGTAVAATFCLNMITEVDASRILETFSDTVDYVKFCIKGYWA